jgi:hypothetical protein
VLLRGRPTSRFLLIIFQDAVNAQQEKGDPLVDALHVASANVHEGRIRRSEDEPGLESKGWDSILMKL